MTRDKKTFHWCGTCSYGRGRGTDRHKPKDCPYKSVNADNVKKTEDEDADRSELLIMDLVDSGFYAIAFS